MTDTARVFHKTIGESALDVQTFGLVKFLL